MVPILSILCPKQPLRDVDPPFLFPDLCLFGVGWSLRRRAHIPLARVSMRKSRSNRIRERTASSRLSLSSDSRNSASSSPSKLLRDWNTDWEGQQTLAPSGKYAVQRDVQRDVLLMKTEVHAWERSTRLLWVRGDLNVSTFKTACINQERKMLMTPAVLECELRWIWLPTDQRPIVELIQRFPLWLESNTSFPWGLCAFYRSVR